MKLIHLSDLHLGKRVNRFSMLEDQTFILREILRIIDAEQPDGILIAGDVYDRTAPSAEAVELLDDFLVSLAARKQQVFLISGNHDSPERLAFGGRLMDAEGIHISRVFDGSPQSYVLEDRYGSVRIWLLPFVKPANVRRFFPEEEIGDYTDAVRTALARMNPDPAERNVLITHQFVTGAERSESEEISVGGTDNVDASVFDGWDYVALGHIHGPQNAGSGRIRYCGTPLKYSFSEAKHRKSVTVVELGEKGQMNLRTVPLVPLRDLVELRGTYQEVTARTFYERTAWREVYVHITLTDETDIIDAAAKLRVIYKNLMKLDYDNARTRSSAEISDVSAENKSPLELFGELYKLQNAVPMSEEQTEYVSGLISRIWEEHS